MIVFVDNDVLKRNTLEDNTSIGVFCGVECGLDFVDRADTEDKRTTNFRAVSNTVEIYRLIWDFYDWSEIGQKLKRHRDEYSDYSGITYIANDEFIYFVFEDTDDNGNANDDKEREHF